MKHKLAILLASSVFCVSAHAQTCLSGAPETAPEEDFIQLTTAEVLQFSTDLVWQRCALGQTWSGSTCTGEAARYTWQEALVAAHEASATDLAGWRLPNVKELASLTERQCVRPAINETAFPNTPSDDFWTSTPSITDSDRAWSVAFFNSSHSIKEKDRSIFVRLVRTNTSS